MIRNSHRAGDWLATCDECGFVYYASEMSKRWDGAFVDRGCWEPRHPQDFVKPKRDPYPINPTRPNVAAAAVDNTISTFIGETSARTPVNGPASHLFTIS